MENLMSDQIDAGIHLMECIYEELSSFSVEKLEQIKTEENDFIKNRGLNKEAVIEMIDNVLNNQKT